MRAVTASLAARLEAILRLMTRAGGVSARSHGGLLLLAGALVLVVLSAASICSLRIALRQARR